MRTFNDATNGALAQPTVPLVQLILIEFGEGPVALNTSTWDLTWGGITYMGAYGMGKIGNVEDAPGEIKGLQFELSGVAAEHIALALDGADDWQGVPITIRTAVLDANYQMVDAPVEWTGVGDTLNLQEDGEASVIQATAESNAVDLLRGSPLTYSDADQQSLYPGDRAFEYVADQADQPVVWPAKAWFYK